MKFSNLKKLGLLYFSINGLSATLLVIGIRIQAYNCPPFLNLMQKIALMPLVTALFFPIYFLSRKVKA